MDIAGAFLEAPITGDIYVSLNKRIIDILIKIDRNYAKYIDPKTGKFVVKLN